ncbi:MAG: glycosyl hydrolase 108 family protein [Arcobacteraceae bacterium]|jgi:lysozyme family protein|nr:glycosyl hydrolase 108 family protein [Arcobacteraceae bacterium]
MSNKGHFDMAFEEVIGHEGGYVNDSIDRGGETKYGISKRSYPNLDIANLTLDDAKEIYFRDFFATPTLSLQNIKNEKIVCEVFNTAVVMGKSVAGKVLQEALNLLNQNERLYDDLKVDGWIGQKTYEAIQKNNPAILLKVLNGLQFCRFRDIVVNDKTQERFFAGWMKRV